MKTVVIKNNLENATIEDAIKSLSEHTERSIEKEIADKKAADKQIRIKQSSLLIDLIKCNDHKNIDQHLNALPKDKPLEDLLDYAFSENFLTEAIRVNNPQVIELILNFMAKGIGAHYRIHAIVLFALISMNANNVVNKVHVKLQQYLNQHKAVAQIVNDYGLFVMNCMINANDAPNEAAFDTLETLLISHYTATHARKKTSTSRWLGHLPEIFSYLVVNDRLHLADFFLQRINREDHPLVLNRYYQGIPLLLHCHDNKNTAAMAFLIANGVSICATRLYTYQLEIQKVTVERSEYLTVIELCIVKKNYKDLRLIIEKIIKSITEGKFKEIDIFMRHILEVCNNLRDVSAMNVFNEFDLIHLLFQENMPDRTIVRQEYSDFYDKISDWLNRFYSERNKYNRLREVQIPYLTTRLEELDILINLLNKSSSSWQCLLLHCYFGSSDSLNKLAKQDKQRIEHAIIRLETLGHLIKEKNISYLYPRFKEIKELFEADMHNLQEHKSIKREYDSDELSISLLPSFDLQIDSSSNNYMTPLIN